MTEDLKLFLEKYSVPFHERVFLSQKTRIRCGGVCDYWIIPETLEQLERVVRYLYSHHQAFDIVGQTSNLFFRESYHAFAVISTVKLSGYTVQGDELTCECGVSVTKLARECVNKGYEGFYGLVGLPGTVGAAIYNNAGCYDCSLSSMLYSVSFFNENGDIETLDSKAIAFSHRSSVFKRKMKRGVIFSVKLKVRSGSPEVEVAKAEQVKAMRLRVDERSSRTLGSIYSEFKPKFPVRVIAKLLRVLHRLFPPFDTRKALKNILLTLYGYKKLERYISDRNLNTFIWRDDNAEHCFELYTEFMCKAHKKLTMEIEIKS